MFDHQVRGILEIVDSQLRKLQQLRPHENVVSACDIRGTPISFSIPYAELNKLHSSRFWFSPEVWEHRLICEAEYYLISNEIRFTGMRDLFVSF